MGASTLELEFSRAVLAPVTWEEDVRPITHEAVEPDGSAGVEEGSAKNSETAEEVFDAVDPEQIEVRVLPSPQRPSAKEVEAHNACHLPYRSSCAVCVCEVSWQRGWP